MSAESNVDRSRTQLRVIVALLSVILATQLFSVYSTYQQDQIRRGRAGTYQQRVEEAQALMDRQMDMVSELVSGYESLAYDNPDVERISEQQLLAAEHQLLALQLIALQNIQVIALLAATP